MSLRRWLAVSAYALTAAAHSHRPYWDGAADLAFSPGASSLALHEREKISFLVDKIYNVVPPTFRCPELLIIVVAQADARAGESKIGRLKLAEQRLAYVRDAFVRRGVHEDALVLQAEETVTYANRDQPADTLSLEVKANVVWPQNVNRPHAPCTPLLRR